MVLWVRLGRCGEVGVCPTTEPDARTLVQVKRESGATVTRGDLTATAWRKAKKLSQLYAMVANVSAMACFSLPFFIIFSSSASTPTLLSSLLSLYSPLASLPSFAHYMMEQEKIFRSSPTSDPLLRIAAYARNGERRTALHGVQSCCFFERTRFPAAAQSRTSVMGRRIFFLYTEKSMYILMETTEGESRFPARANTTMDSPRDLFPTVAWANVNCIL